MFLPELVKNRGYVVHFSEENGTFLLYKKLEEDHKVAHYSSHNIGVGGIVMHSDMKRILLI